VAPYKKVLTHGFTVDAQGKKMSKSLGNVVAPQKIVGTLGADILRLWVAGSDYSNEMTVSDEILKRSADSYRRIRNTARFLLANLNGFDPASDKLDNAELLSLDRWAIARTLEIQKEVVAAYKDFNFHLIHQKLQHFCTVDLGGFYLDIIKDRQYTTQSDSIARRSAQTALYHIAEAMCRWMAPILSFTADELWKSIPGQRSQSVLLENWYGELSELDDSEKMNMAFWQTVLEVRAAVSKELEALRADKTIGSSLDATVTLFVDESLRADLESLQQELRFVLITSEASVNSLEQADDSCIEATIESGQTIRIRVSASEQAKCVRCWHHREDVGNNAEHPELCGRCVENVAGDGEQRYFA
ncbi:MAG: class I tRNA ligase family protein, partial [Gammaproteobacteria bacterium]|nr:class I tRNA ligase family protein [Gammaproteobacteria bacterium]